MVDLEMKSLSLIIQNTTRVHKYGYSLNNEDFGIGIVGGEPKSEKFNEYKKDFWKTEEGKFCENFWITEKKPKNIENVYKFYKDLVTTNFQETEKLLMYGYYDVIFEVDTSSNHIEYSSRSPYEYDETVKIGLYDYKNVKYAIDMDYLDYLDGNKKENYIKQSFLNQSLYPHTIYEFSDENDPIEDFLDIEPFYSLEIPSQKQMGITWPIYDDYEGKDVIDDDDYLDIKKFLELDNDTILLCMMADPNPDFPDYYDPEPEFVFPISRSYIRNLYNPLEDNGIYKVPFTSFSYKCTRDNEGLDDDMTYNITGNQIDWLSPYFKITGGPQDIYINTRDAMMMMYSSNHKVFSIIKEKEIPISAGINVVSRPDGNNVFGQDLNIVSADHCQGGTNKTIYRAFISDIAEYIEIEREEVSNTEAITKEKLYENYPEIADILENTQRCKDPQIMSRGEIRKVLRENDMTIEDLEKLSVIYEKRAKLNKIMSMDVPHPVKVRAQQEIQNTSISEITADDVIANNCVYDKVYNVLIEHIIFKDESEDKGQLKEIAKGPYEPFEGLEYKIMVFLRQNRDKVEGNGILYGENGIYPKSMEYLFKDKIDIHSLISDLKETLANLKLYEFYPLEPYIIEDYKRIISELEESSGEEYTNETIKYLNLIDNATHEDKLFFSIFSEIKEWPDINHTSTDLKISSSCYNIIKCLNSFYSPNGMRTVKEIFYDLANKLKDYSEAEDYFLITDKIEPLFKQKQKRLDIPKYVELVKEIFEIVQDWTISNYSKIDRIEEYEVFVTDLKEGDKIDELIKPNIMAIINDMIYDLLHVLAPLWEFDKDDISFDENSLPVARILEFDDEPVLSINDLINREYTDEELAEMEEEWNVIDQ